MIHRRAARLVTAAVAVSSGLLAATMAAGPALADTPVAGCGGQSCWVADQSQWIHLSGSVASGPTGFAPVPVPPPPCWMTPDFSGPLMYQLYEQSKGQRVGPNGIDPWGGSYKQYVPDIIKHKNDPGMWYGPVMLTTPAGLACGNQLPLMAWVPPGTAPPAPPIPPATLAAYAYDHMKIPSPALVVNPAGRNYVDLPAYVWARAAGPGIQAGGPNIPAGGNMPASLSITASAGNTSVTLTASTKQLVLTDSSGTVYSPCPPTGSRYRPVGTAPENSGPGTKPDCGVVFTAPSTANTIGASLTYTINVTGAQIGFNPITVTGGKTVSVAEIQNLNGG